MRYTCPRVAFPAKLVAKLLKGPNPCARCWVNWGGAIHGPFLRTTTIFLLLSAAIFLGMTESANAQVWVSSGFKPVADAQHETAYCSTSAVNPTTGQTSPAATDYPWLMTYCSVTSSTGVTFTNSSSPSCSYENADMSASWQYFASMGDGGNPTAICTIDFPVQSGIEYTVNSGHLIVFFEPPDSDNHDYYCDTSYAYMLCGVYSDPEGFMILPLEFGPSFSTLGSSIVQEVTGSMTGTGAGQSFPMVSEINVPPILGNFMGLWQIASTSAQYTACSTPTITSITPSGWWAGQKQDITINGGCFQTSSDAGGPSKVTLTDGANEVKLSNVSVGSTTQITATVNVTKKAPAETVTLTVTNPSGSAKPGSATANPAPVVLPVPVIKWRDKKISGDNANNQSVIVGQPVELTTTPATLPGGFTVSNSTWKIEGTTIKSYQGDDSGITLEDTDLDKQNTTFYWLYKDDPLDVTYEYCATDPNANQLCTSPQAKATFKATRPKIDLTVTNPYNRAKVNELPVCGQKKEKMAHMFYGDLHYRSGCTPPYTGPVGIDLTASGGGNGTYKFVQVLSTDTLTWNGQKPFHCGPYVNVLDFGFPFPGVSPLPPAAPQKAYDGPGQSLPNIYSSGTRDFHAVMYLLWQPPQLKGTSTTSYPVPIGHQEWQFMAIADQKAPIGEGKWRQPTTTAAGKVGDFVPSSESDNPVYGYPTWDGVSGITSCDPTNQTQEVPE
jgi:hypothetical protein